MKVEADIRAKFPGKARRADYERSRSNAIQLHCLTCCGGSRKVAKECTSFDCFLWPFGLASGSRPSGSIPTEEWYLSETEAARERTAQRLQGDS